MTGEKDILKRLPKNTPTWSVGVVAIIVAITAAVISIYALMQGQISEYVKNKHEVVTTKAKADENSNQVMLSLLTEQSEQINSVTDSLQTTAKQNVNLSERITELEKRVAEVSLKFDACKDLLAEYKAASKTSKQSQEPIIEPPKK